MAGFDTVAKTAANRAPHPESIAEEKRRALADALGAADSHNRRETFSRQAF